MLQRGPLIVSYAKSIAKYEFRISNVWNCICHWI